MFPYVASDIKNINTCGTPEEFKKNAALILNQGALSKINSQYASLISEGTKVSVNFLRKKSSMVFRIICAPPTKASEATKLLPY